MPHSIAIRLSAQCDDGTSQTLRMVWITDDVKEIQCQYKHYTVTMSCINMYYSASCIIILQVLT